MTELAKVRDEEVLDDRGARAAYERLLELRPGDAKAEEFIETSDAKRAKWADIVAKYVDEAKQAADAPFKERRCSGRGGGGRVPVRAPAAFERQEEEAAPAR